jgi:hypothetical protein
MRFTIWRRRNNPAPREGVTLDHFDRESSHVTCLIDFAPAKRGHYNFRAMIRRLSCGGRMPVVPAAAAPHRPMDQASATIRISGGRRLLA